VSETRPLVHGNKAVSGESRPRARGLLRAPVFWRIGLIVLAVIATLVAGVFGLIYPSTYAPLIAGGAIATTAAMLACLRRPVWALYAALFVVLLPIGLIPADTHSLLNRSMAMVALATWLVGAPSRHRGGRWTATVMIMIGFLAWSMVTLLWADNVSAGVTILQAYALRLILFLFLIPSEIRTRERLDGLMNTLALSGWLLMVAGAGTLLLQGYTPGTRLKVLDVNENGLGILALVTMIGVLWQAVRPSQRHAQLKVLGSWVFLFGMIGLVAVSGSRGSALSLVVTLLAFCVWRPTRRWGMVGVLAVAVGIILAPSLFLTTLERFAGGGSETLLGGREALWQAGARLFLDHPWGGVGIGSSAFSVMPYARLLRSIEYAWASIHNPVLVILTETGIPGLLLYFGVLGSAAFSFARQARQHHSSASRALAPYFALVTSAFLGYMVSWIKGGGTESDFTYFLMLGLLLIPSGLALEDKGETERLE